MRRLTPNIDTPAGSASGGRRPVPTLRNDVPQPKGDPVGSITRQQRLEFGRRLRAWYAAHHRDLPWRRTRNPYHVLVSELMLQQTQVARVVTKYHDFLLRFPTLQSVAAAPPARVREAWHGLGYYARARNLHRLARAVVQDDPAATLPDDPVDLRRLPGIGAYTAGAVASFAYERRTAVVDTNVARVLRRVFAPKLSPDTPAGQRMLWRIAEAILPRTGHASYTHNQALMELGALICTARVRRCGRCPLRRICATAAAE
jgi:A/G-specific adenine glycosylase